VGHALHCVVMECFIRARLSLRPEVYRCVLFATLRRRTWWAAEREVVRTCHPNHSATCASASFSSATAFASCSCFHRPYQLVLGISRCMHAHHAHCVT
jgi:hypothetical protein